MNLNRLRDVHGVEVEWKISLLTIIMEG